MFEIKWHKNDEKSVRFDPDFTRGVNMLRNMVQNHIRGSTSAETTEKLLVKNNLLTYFWQGVSLVRYIHQKKKNLIIYAYVIMSNHIHMIAKSGDGKLSDTIRDFKSFTTKRLVAAIKEYPESRREWILWMFERAAKKHKRNMNYQIWTHNNPEEYLYSTAASYAGMPGLLEVSKLE